MLLAITCCGHFSLSAQQVPYDPLGPELDQKNTNLRVIADPPSGEGKNAIREKVLKRNPVNAIEVVDDESSVGQSSGERPIPPKPIDEESGQVGLPKMTNSSDKKATEQELVGYDEGEKPPLRKIPPPPKDEKN